MSGTIQRFSQIRYVDADRNMQKTVLQVPNQIIDRTVNGMAESIQSIAAGGTGVALGIGGVTSPGYAGFLNLSNADNVEIGFRVSGTFYPAILLAPGDYADVPLSPAQTWYARGVGNAVDLQFSIFQRNP